MISYGHLGTEKWKESERIKGIAHCLQAIDTGVSTCGNFLSEIGFLGKTPQAGLTPSETSGNVVKE